MRSRIAVKSASAASNSLKASGAPSRTSHCQIGSSEARRIWPGRTGRLPSTRNGSSGAEGEPRRIVGARPRLVVGAADDLAQLLEHEGGDR